MLSMKLGDHNALYCLRSYSVLLFSVFSTFFVILFVWSHFLPFPVFVKILEMSDYSSLTLAYLSFQKYIIDWYYQW